MKKLVSIFLTIVLIGGLLTGCQQKNQADGAETPKDKAGPITITDPTGKEITIPSEVETIVSMGPSITQVLVELGLGDKIIAVDSYSTEIEGLKSNLPAIDMMTPDAEQIIVLNPDLVLATTMIMSAGDNPLIQISENQIAVAYIESSQSIEGIYKDIEFIAGLVRAEDQGRELVDNMKKEIEKIKKIGATITDKKSVYFEIGQTPKLYSFGKNVFLNEMIEIIGAKNIFTDQDRWTSVSEEAILAADPDVILTNVNYVENAVEEIKTRNGWDNIKAVKNNAVYYINNDYSSQPNHNIIKALEEMAQAIYPDKY